MQPSHFVSLEDFSGSELWHFIKVAQQLKLEQKTGNSKKILHDKTLAMIFQKPSLRTRMSFEVGMAHLGGHAVHLAQDDIQFGQRETSEDIALVLSRFSDAIMARVYEHSTITELARYASVPVINALSDREHPCQILGDLLTVWEHKQKLEGLKVAWIGDGNNVCHSWLHAAPKLGMEIAIACPKGYEPDAEILSYAKSFGPKVTLTDEPMEAVAKADVLCTDVWASMGEESLAEQKKSAFCGFKIDKLLLSMAHPDAIVMHCLPAHYGEEIDSEVAHGPQSVIFDEAENRLHSTKAILAILMQ